MTTKKILFPTDLSELGTSALEYAAALAKASQAELLIVHVEEPGTPYVFGEGYSYGGAMPGSIEVRKLLEAVKPQDPDIQCRHRLLSGNPADEIVRLAAEEHVDVIVMATHGRTGLTHLLMGSVAESVLRRADCRVLTFKAEQKTVQQTTIS